MVAQPQNRARQRLGIPRHQNTGTRKEKARVRLTPETMAGITVKGGRNGIPQHRTSQNSCMTPMVNPDPHLQAPRDHGRNRKSNSNSLSAHPGDLMEAGEAGVVSPIVAEEQLDFAPELTTPRSSCALPQDYPLKSSRTPRPKTTLPPQDKQTNSVSKKKRLGNMLEGNITLIIQNPHRDYGNPRPALMAAASCEVLGRFSITKVRKSSPSIGERPNLPAYLS